MAGPVFCAQQEAAVTGESPIWDAVRGVLWWIDIQGRRLLGHAEGGAAIAPKMLPSEPGLIALAEDGRLVLGLEEGLSAFTPESGALELVTPIAHDRPNIRLNDGKVDPQGRLWFGSMDKSGSGAPVGSLFCRLRDGTIVTARRDVRVPNAIAFSPDGTILYFSDSPSQEILAFTLDPVTADLSGERVFARTYGEERPDGTAVDSEGNLWVAIVHGGRIDRLSPDGTATASIRVPVRKPTMPAFGGADMRRLFVTSQRRFLDAGQLAQQPLAGALLAVDVPVAGLEPSRLRL